MEWELLEALPATDRERVLGAARRRQFRRGEPVVREGEPADCMHLVESGVFAVEISAPDGERATLNVLAAGDFFGELSLVASAGQPQRTATVVALSAGATLAITAAAFTALRQAHPEVERLLVSALAHRVEELSARLLEAQHTSVDRRVLRRLLELAEIFDSPGAEVVIPLSQEDLATMAGAARPTVNQVLQRLVAAGAIALGRRQILLRDLVALRAAAADET